MGANYITKEGLEKLEQELEYLKKQKMPAIIERIAAAKELGDLSENAEYQEAKEDQGFTAGRIVEIEQLVKRAEIITQNDSDDKVNIGSTIRVSCNEKEYKYTIVGSNEADPPAGLISNESPIGRAFLGRKIGEKITVTVPKGIMECEILEIK